MLTVEALNAAASARARRSNLALGSATLTLVLGDVGAKVFATGEATTDLMLMLFAWVPGLVLLFVGPWINGRITKRDDRGWCPHCRQSLIQLSGLVIMTRNCGHCGRQVLAKREATGTFHDAEPTAV